MKGNRVSIQQTHSPDTDVSTSPSSYLPSAGVGVDGYLAGATTMAIHCCGHFLTGEKSLYFLLGGHKLPCLCSLQGITYELCIPVYF